MNWVDLALIVLAGFSLVRGLRLGAVVQVLSFGGFWVGLAVGAAVAPFAAGVVHSPTAKVVVSLVVVFGAASLVGGLGRQVGVRAWRGVRRLHLGAADSGVGAFVAVGATLLASWVVASMLVSGPWPALVRQIEGSSIIGEMNAVLPPAPNVFSRIQHLLNTHGFPQVFAQFAPGAATGPITLPSSPFMYAAVKAAGASTVKIEGEGCGELLEGSGFVVAPDLVVTNAHVIAGTHHITVADQSGVHPAQPIFFDPKFDLAVLRTVPLHEPVLQIDPNEVAVGTQAAVLGYPEGGPFDSQAAQVRQTFDAVGRDIYGGSLTRRQVYELAAKVRPGNSGGPLVEENGTVIGVVFSRSASDPTIGYALASPKVLAEVHQAEQSPGPVGTGACAD